MLNLKQEKGNVAIYLVSVSISLVTVAFKAIVKDITIYFASLPLRRF